MQDFVHRLPRRQHFLQANDCNEGEDGMGVPFSISRYKISFARSAEGSSESEIRAAFRYLHPSLSARNSLPRPDEGGKEPSPLMRERGMSLCAISLVLSVQAVIIQAVIILCLSRRL